MTSVSSTRSQPVRDPKPATSQTARPEPKPGDVRAMADAFAAARRQMPQGKQAALPQDKLAKMPKGDADARFAEVKDRAAADDPFADSLLRDRDRQDRQEGGFGMAGQPGGAPLPIQVPAMPNPQVDPAAFAQMLADLWTRENGKGSKEVSVKFGDNAWPATGARLVRNAGGALDIALLVGDRGRTHGDALAGLEQHLTGSGVAVGSLVVEDEAG